MGIDLRLFHMSHRGDFIEEIGLLATSDTIGLVIPTENLQQWQNTVC